MRPNDLVWDHHHTNRHYYGEDGGVVCICLFSHLQCARLKRKVFCHRKGVVWGVLVVFCMEDRKEGYKVDRREGNLAEVLEELERIPQGLESGEECAVELVGIQQGLPLMRQEHLLLEPTLHNEN